LKLSGIASAVLHQKPKSKSLCNCQAFRGHTLGRHTSDGFSIKRLAARNFDEPGGRQFVDIFIDREWTRHITMPKKSGGRSTIETWLPTGMSAQRAARRQCWLARLTKLRSHPAHGGSGFASLQPPAFSDLAGCNHYAPKYRKFRTCLERAP
jgi:hypothetical protein